MDSTDIIDLKITKKFKNINFYIKITNALMKHIKDLMVTIKKKEL